MLTQARLKEVLHYDADSGIFRWKTSTNRRIKALQVAGCIRGDGYMLIGIDRKFYLAHRLAWLYVHGSWPVDQIDHISGCRTDNRICNLREATGAENMQNHRNPPSSNKSGFLGVSLRLELKKYQACIKIMGKNKHLGLFDTPEQAHEAYLKAKRSHHKFCTI